MAGEIQIMIPQYGELNRIYSDFIESYLFLLTSRNSSRTSTKQYNDTKPLLKPKRILELVLDKQKEQCTPP